MLAGILLLHMSQEKTIPYKVRRKKHSLLSVICLLMLLSAAFLYLRYKRPTYIISANLINRDTRNWQLEEHGKLKLRSAITTAVKKLNLSVRYQKRGRIVKQELYQNSPIRFQLVRTGVSGSDQFSVSINNQNTYLLKHGTSNAVEFVFNKIYTTEIGSWLISKMPSYDEFRGQTIIVDVENPELVTERLLSEVQISAVAHDHNLTQISIKDNVLSRGEAILRQVIDQLNSALDQESATEAAIDIKHIDQSLSVFGDKVDSLQRELNALSNVERNLQLSTTATNYLVSARTNEITRNEIGFKLMALNGFEDYLKYRDLNTDLPPSAAVLSNLPLEKLVSQLIVLQSQSEQLLQTHLQNDPVFEPLVQQTGKIKTLMAQNIISLKSALLKRQADLAPMDNRSKIILNGMPSWERNLVSLKRKQISYENQYAFLLKRREEASLKRAALVRVNEAKYPLQIKYN
jgi:hypothetical protein